jgi:hypothetical protein
MLIKLAIFKSNSFICSKRIALFGFSFNSLHSRSNQNSHDKKPSGQQNVFYFEPSKLLPVDKNHPEYTNLYKKIPVVAVLGWAGAHDQNLKKYEQIYGSLG